MNARIGGDNNTGANIVNNLAFLSHLSGCYGVTNAHGPSQNQQEASITQSCNSTRKSIHYFSGFAFLYIILSSQTR